MEVGVQIYNGNNQIIIDSNYMNLALRYKGAITTTSTANFHYTVDLTLTCVNPLIAFRCTTDYAYLVSQKNNNNGTWTFRLGSYNPSQSISYWVFDEPVLGGSTYGYQVFNPAGKLVFDALFPYMRPTSMYMDTTGSLISNDVSLAGNANRLYAIAQNGMFVIQFVGLEDPGGTPIYNVAISGSCAKFLSSNVATLSMKQLYYTITGTIAYTGGGGTPSYLMIDVTDI
jgi:hypothetical protein